MKLRLIKIITFLGGIYFFIEFIFPKYIVIGGTAIEIGAYQSTALKVLQVVGSMAIGLGVINLGRIHGFAVLRMREGWGYSLILMASMILTMLAGMLMWYYDEFHGGSEALSNLFWQFIFNGIYNNLGSAMFSLLAFYIAVAAYRSFRVQNMEAALMMGAAIIVMIGQIPLGAFLAESISIFNVPRWRSWLLTKINVPVFRAILFGSLIAGLSMSVRMWLSLDRTEFKE